MQGRRLRELGLPEAQAYFEAVCGPSGWRKFQQLEAEHRVDVQRINEEADRKILKIRRDTN